MDRQWVACALAVAIGLGMAGCSKEPEAVTQADVAAATAVRHEANAVANVELQAALECGAAWIDQFKAKEAERSEASQRSPIKAQIAPDALVYWGWQNSYSGGIDFCPNNPGLAGKPQVDFIGEHPFDVMGELVPYHAQKAATYVPAPKGEFEKSADYEARIAQEKAAFEAKAGAGKVSAAGVEVAWAAIMGEPGLKDRQDSNDPEPVTYDADSETLRFTVISRKVAREVAADGVRLLRPSVEIPVAVKMSPQNAQKVVAALREARYANVFPVVAMELKGGVLTVKEVSLNSLPSRVSGVDFGESGPLLANLPVNYEFPLRF